MARLSRRNRKKLVSEINVVPYIDVMLVLLVIFMVTAPMLAPGIVIELPEVNAEPLPVDSNVEPLSVSVKEDGSIHLNLGDENEVLSFATVKDRIFKVLAAKPDTPIQFRGDQDLSYGEAMKVLAGIQEVGGSEFQLEVVTP
mgnify:CR=1 FL=1